MASTSPQRQGPLSAGRRRPLILAVVLAILVVVQLAAVPGARVAEASLMADVQRAQADLVQGGKLLEDAYRTQSAALTTRASDSFARSRQQLQSLAGRLQALQIAAAPASPAPLRERVVSLDAVIRMGSQIDLAGMTAARVLLASGLVGGTVGTSPPTGALNSLLASVRDDLAAADQDAAAINVSVLPASQQLTLVKALGALHTAVAGLKALWPSLGAVLGLLGLDGPRTYLIEQTNPAELRAGGGFIGTVSLVHADRGRITLAKSLPVEAFDYCDAVGCVHPRPQPWQAGYVAPPAELAGPPLPAYSRLTAWSLEDSGFAPDFATNAATAEKFARQLLGTDVSGVVAVDFYAVAPLLNLTGPISLPQFDVTLTAANFVDTVVGLDLARTYTHKDVISAAANQIVSRLSHVKPGDLPRLLQIVEDEVRGRHLQVHFDDATIQHQAARLGATDSLNPPGAADFLLETEDNYGGSKANYFVDRRFRLDLSRSGSILHHRLTVSLHDGAPADKLYIGPHYFAYVRITVPANATRVTVASAPSTEYLPIEEPARRTQVPPAGSQVAGGWIFVLVGQGLSGNYQAIFTWDTPWAPAADGTDRLYWQKQPGTVHDAVQVTWNPGTGSSSTSTDLSQDRVVTLTQNAVSVQPARGP